MSGTGMPEALTRALAEDEAARAFFEGLTAGQRRRYGQWVGGARQPEAQADRARWALVQLRKGREKLVVGCYMGDVGIIKHIEDDPALKEALISLGDDKSHRAMSRYAVLLAEHVLDMTGMPRDAVMAWCFEINERWQRGGAHFQEARDVAGEYFALAREERDTVRARTLRVMGQVAATPHVKRHALIASDYAVTVVNALRPGDMEAVRAERRAQLAMLAGVD